MYRPIGRPAIKLLSVMTAAAACVTLAGAAGATASSASVACKAWQALQVSGTGGQQYVIRNKPSINHNDQGMCLSEPGRRAAFTVTRSPGWAHSAKVRAYPYIGTGCFEGACPAGGAGVMQRAGSLGNYTVRWATVTPRHSGVWDASLDLWLGPHIGAGSSEVMIWLRYSKPPWWEGLYPTVKIDGAKWYEVPHTTAAGRYYISFRRATPVASAKLRIAPFMAAAERLGAVQKSWLLWCVQAGFEIWSGGKGLAITKFSVTQ
jgi:Glycosyl hydrolase family 12